MKSMYTAELPIDNALVLSNLREYGHDWYIAKNYILWAKFLSWTVQVYLQPLYHEWALKATKFGDIMQNKGRCTVQGHWFCYQSKAHMWLPVSD